MASLASHPLERMYLSLAGLSVGDAMGETFFGPNPDILNRIARREVTRAPWHYTDDTEMALSVVEVLARNGCIDQNTLMEAFTCRFNPARGYGMATFYLLQSVRQGADWRAEVKQSFGGEGSFGNGAAMRIAPLGAYFAEHLEQVRDNAILAAQTTHTHAEGVAGAIAVAIATALAARLEDGETINNERLFERLLEFVPPGETRDGISEAAALSSSTAPQDAAHRLGSGQLVSAQDTVPFVLWCVINHLDNYEEALWTTVQGLGDRDTTCAMVGGIVAVSDRDLGIPPAWIAAREPLPHDIKALLAT